MDNICSIEKCTSCNVCTTVCPKQCIQLTDDKHGHLVPVINHKYCIDCKLCERNCHNNHLLELSSPIKCFAMRYNDLSSLYSSSGGISYLLTKKILEFKGVVYGAAFVDGIVSHIRIDNTNDLFRLQGSKYVQSIVENHIYRQLKNDAQSGKRVLYTGTGCQIAAAKTFLKKEYVNVIYVEILCHGTPSSKFLSEYVSIFTKELPEEIVFRKKGRYILEVLRNKKILLKKNLRNSMYLQGFLHDIILHPSCYDCNYSGEKRIGDITLGDYWGHLLNGKSCSVVLCNNSKGIDIITSIFEFCEYEETNFNSVARTNKPLRESADYNIYSRIFAILYPVIGFRHALNISTFHHRLKNILLKVLNK